MPARRKILIADDNDDLRDTMTMYLAEIIPEADVVGASDAESALVLVHEGRQHNRPFDVVITDNRMRGLTGLGLLRILREEEDDAARILVSADADVEDVARAERAVDLFLAKPFDPAALGSRVRSHIVAKHGLKRSETEAHDGSGRSKP